MNSDTDLHFITYLALLALIVVGYLYYRERNAHHRRTERQPIPDVQFISQVKRPNLQSQPYYDSGPSLPTFSAQEADARKMPKTIDLTTVSRRNLQNSSDFRSNNVSPFDPNGERSQNLGQSNKPVEGFRKQGFYEPSRYVTEIDYKKPKPQNVPFEDIPAVDRSYYVTIEDETGKGEINYDKQNGYISSKDLRGDLNASPYRPSGTEGIGNNAYGYPFRTSASPDNTTNIRKKSDMQEEENNQPANKAQELGDSKKDVNQKSRLSDNSTSQRPAKNNIVQKSERKYQKRHIFMDNDDSEDEMVVEERREQTNKYKRPATDSKGLEEIEKQASDKKYIKDNNSQPRIKPQEKNIPLEDENEAEEIRKEPENESRTQNKKKKIDLSYVSEYGSNTTMKKYIEKKAKREEIMSSKPSEPEPFIKKAPTEDTSKKNLLPNLSQKLQTDAPKPTSSLFSGFGTKTAQNQQNAGGDNSNNNSIFKSGTNSSALSQNIIQTKEAEAPIEIEKIASEKSGPSFLFKSQEKPAEEEQKPAAPLLFGGGTLFSQPKQPDSGPSIMNLFNKAPSNETKPQENEKETVAKDEEQKNDSPKAPEKPKPLGLFGNNLTAGGFSLFKNNESTENKVVAPENQGIKLGEGQKKEEKQELKPEEVEKPETKKIQTTEIAKPQEDKKPEAASPGDQESKPVQKGLSLFSNNSTPALGGLFGRNTSNPSTESNKAESKTEQSESKTEAKSFGLFTQLSKSNSQTGIAGEQSNSKTESRTFGFLPQIQKSNSQGGTTGEQPSNQNKQKEQTNNAEAQEQSSWGLKPDVADGKKESNLGLFNKFLSQKPNNSLLFGGTTPGEKKEGTQTGLLTGSGLLFKNTDITQAQNGLGSLSPKKSSDPLAPYSKPPDGLQEGQFGQKRDSPKKSDNKLIWSSKPAEDRNNKSEGSLFGQKADSPKKSDNNLRSNIFKPSENGADKPTGSIFSTLGAFSNTQNKAGGLFANSGNTDNKGFSSIFSNQQTSNEDKK